MIGSHTLLRNSCNVHIPVVIENLKAVNVEYSNNGTVNSSSYANLQLVVDMLHDPCKEPLIYGLRERERRKEGESNNG